MSPEARRRIRRARRIVVRVLLITLLVLLGAVGVAIAALHTPWGREQQRRQVERLLEGAFAGDVRVRAMTGSVFGDVVFHDVVIDDTTARPAVSIERLRLDLALVPLLGRQVRFYDIEATGVVVDGRRLPEGRLNLELLLEQKDGEEEQESSWSVAIDDLAIAAGRVSIEQASGDRVHVDAIAANVEIELPAGGPTRVEGDIGGMWRERDLPVAAAIVLASGMEGLAIPRAKAALGELRVAGTDIRIVGNEVHGQAVVDAPAEAVAKVVPDSPLVGDIALELAASPAARGGSAITVSGTVGGATLDADLGVTPALERVAGTVRVANVDAARILRDATPSDVDATVTVDVVRDGAGPGVAALRGNATARAKGSVDELRADDLDVRVVLDHGAVTARGRVRGEAELDARFDAALTFAERAITLDAASIVATVGDVERATGGRVPVEGGLTADLDVRGRLDRPSLSVAGTVRGTRLRVGTRRAGALVATLDARGLPADPQGSARVELRDIVDGETHLGHLLVDARSRPDDAIAVNIRSEPPWKPWLVRIDALVHLEEDVRIELGTHRVTTAGVEWHGHGGTIRIDDERIRVARLRTTIASGALAIDGTYRHGGRRAGDFATSVHLDGVDLREVDESFDRPETWRGLVDARVHVIKRGPRWYGSVAGEAHEVRLRDRARPIDARGEVRLAPGTVVVDAEIGGRGVGTMTVDLDVAAPRRMENPAAWQRLEREAIRRGHVVADELDLAALAAVAGVESPVRGRLDGELTLSAHDARATLRAYEVTTPDLPAPLDATLVVDEAPDDLIAANLIATLRDLGTARAEAMLAIPARPFDVHAWSRLDEDAFRGATLRVEELRLDAERSRRLGLVDSWWGRADLLVEVAPRFETVGLSLDLDRVRGGPFARPVDAHLHGTIDADGLDARLWGALDGRRVIRGSAKIPIRVADVRRDGAAALRAAPIDATLQLRCAPIAAVAATFGREQPLVGTIEATATVDGTVGAPTADARLLIRGLGVRRATLRELSATARWDGRIVTVRARGRQRDAGEVRVDARADVRSIDAATATIYADRFDLAPLAALAPQPLIGVRGVVDAAVVIDGLDPETAKVNGTVTIARARLPLGGEVGTMRDGDVRILLRRNQLTIRGDGKIGRGTARLRVEGVTRGLLPERAQADLSFSNVTLLVEGQPTVEADLRARLRRQGDRWSVDAEVRRGRVNMPEGDGAPLHDAGKPDDMVIIENGRPPPRAIEPEPTWKTLLGQRPTTPRFVVRVRIRPIAVRTDDFRGRVTGEVTLTYGTDGIAIDGEIGTTGASVALFDRLYRVDRGNVRFDGTLDPVLDVALVKEFPQLTLFVEVRGRLSKPDLALSSRPATYTEGQLLSFLLGGSPGTDPGTEVRDAATGVASALLSQKLGGYVEDYLPFEVDVLRFEAATASESASFTVGKWLTRRLFVAFRRRLEARTDQNAGEAELEYWLAPDIILEATAGDRGHHEADLLWLKRW